MILSTTMIAALAAVSPAPSPAAAAPAPADSVSVPHPSGTAQADYRGAITVAHKQIGSAAPAGRPSSLRCVWSASLEVNRTATTPTGTLASRSFVQEDVAEGSRPGWCTANRSAIARDVAQRVGDGSQHLAKAAAADRAVLLADLDRLTPSAMGN